MRIEEPAGPSFAKRISGYTKEDGLADISFDGVVHPPVFIIDKLIFESSLNAGFFQLPDSQPAIMLFIGIKFFGFSRAFYNAR